MTKDSAVGRFTPFVCVDLFAGGGGFSEGFRCAGFRIAAQVEVNKKAAETLRCNFGNRGTLVIEDDIRNICPKELEQRIGEYSGHNGSIDVLIASPPCQGLSHIGNGRITTKKRIQTNSLFLEVIRFLLELKPKVFVVENVPEAFTRWDGLVGMRLVDSAEAAGYFVRYKNLNAAEYGVPQRRIRTFILGSCLINNIRFPRRTHIDLASQNPIRTGKSLVTVHDAISDLPVLEVGEGNDECEPYSSQIPRNSYQRSMRRGINASASLRYCRTRRHGHLVLKRIKNLRMGQSAIHLPPDLRPKHVIGMFKSKYRRILDNEPSPTVVAHLERDGYMFIHPNQDRTLNVREAARFQSFHDSYEFFGNMGDKFRQIGNAVPPILAESLGREIMRHLTHLKVSFSNSTSEYRSNVCRHLQKVVSLMFRDVNSTKESSTHPYAFLPIEREELVCVE